MPTPEIPKTSPATSDTPPAAKIRWKRDFTVEDGDVTCFDGFVGDVAVMSLHGGGKNDWWVVGVDFNPAPEVFTERGDRGVRTLAAGEALAQSILDDYVRFLVTGSTE